MQRPSPHNTHNSTVKIIIRKTMKYTRKLAALAPIHLTHAVALTIPVQTLNPASADAIMDR